MNLELTRITPEIRAAVAAIASLSGAPVTVRETVVIETPDPDLHDQLRLAVGTYQGKVVIHFGTPIQALGLTVAQARSIASELLKRAGELDPQRKRHGGK